VRENQRYNAWKTDPSSFFWLYGIPGCGKTILSATVIEDVRTLYSPSIDATGAMAAYFFFDFNDLEKQKSELMLKSLVSQFCQRYHNLPPALELLWSSCNVSREQPSTDQLLDALQSLTESRTSFIVLDALDECGDRAELLSILESISGWKNAGLHVLMTSRKERDIEETLEDIVRRTDMVPLEATVVDNDIRDYVRHRLSTDRGLKKWKKESTEIESAMMKGANGMYAHALL